jgi:uncharacterized protein
MILVRSPLIDLSLAEARAITVSAQGLHRPEVVAASGAQVLASLGCIQLDTINVVRRSHELVFLSRKVPDVQASAFLLHDAPVAFESWAHAASLLPLAAWPLLGFRRRHIKAYGWRGPAVDQGACQYVREVVADLGEATVTELGGARGNGWERDAPAKWAAEWLLATGELVCVKRRGWRRVYQAAAQALPAALLNCELEDADCISELIQIALNALGVATADDIADYFRLSKETVTEYLAEMEKIESAAVEGWPQQAWVLPEKLTTPEIDPHACTPLSPFDSLVWYRPRVRRLFGVDYVLEAYKPSGNRECGYFGMPVLSGTQIVGRIALRSRGGVLRLEGHQIADGHDPEQLHRAIHAAAAWMGTIAIDPSPLCPPGCRSLDHDGV